MIPYGIPILLGVVTGTLARLYMLRVDYRQYPSYPHGYVNHLAMGVIAALVGAVAVPALKEKEFVAATFLLLVAQQFREIRNMERKSLTELEDIELIPRGSAYIEGIAKVFEARNYLVMLVSLAASGGAVMVSPWFGLLAAIFALIPSIWLMRRQVIGQVAVVRPARFFFRGAGLWVENIYIMNIGLAESRDYIMKHGLAVMLEPKDDNARDTLASVGQRQAIIHDAVTVLGIKKDIALPEFTSLIRRDIDTGKVGMFIIPMEKDIEALLSVIRRVPVLESTRGRALSAHAGRIASD